MIKRAIIVALLACGAPFWLLLRARFGGQFILLLASVWGLELAGLWLAASGYVPDLPMIWVYWCREMVVLYLLMSWIWLAQAFFWMIYEGESLLHQQGGARPLHAGVVWVASKPSPFLDLIVTFFGLCILGMGVKSVPKPLEDLTALIFAASAGSFFLLALVCHANGNTLPMAIKPRKPRPVRTKRFIAKSHAHAKRSSEGLAHIFSRRDPALKQLTTR